jgi:hypothetical protein
MLSITRWKIITLVVLTLMALVIHHNADINVQVGGRVFDIEDDGRTLRIWGYRCEFDQPQLAQLGDELTIEGTATGQPVAVNSERLVKCRIINRGPLHRKVLP